MSQEAMKWFKRTPKFDANGKQLLHAGQIAVMFYLADQTNAKSGCAFPSLRRMSKDMGIDRKTLIDILKALKAMGWIRVQRAYEATSGTRRSNRYYLPCAPGGNPWKYWETRPRDENGDLGLEAVPGDDGRWKLAPSEPL